MFYANSVPGIDRPVVYSGNKCDFTGNLAGAGSHAHTCFSSSGFNKVTVADNSMDLTYWAGGSGEFGILVRGTTATTSTVSGNWIKNSPANSIDVTGYTTVSGNFLDKTGCGNGAHPDTVTWYGFEDKATGSSTVDNFVITRNLVNYANCGTFIAADGWTGGSANPTNNAKSLNSDNCGHTERSHAVRRPDVLGRRRLRRRRDDGSAHRTGVWRQRSDGQSQGVDQRKQIVPTVRPGLRRQGRPNPARHGKHREKCVVQGRHDG